MKAEKFIADESMRSLRGAELAPSTTSLYTLALTRVSAELRGLPLVEAGTYGALEGALQEVSEKYGRSAALNAKKALSGHFVAPLLRHGLIDNDPLAHRIDLASMAKPVDAAPKGSPDLTNSHRLAVINHLLALDPAAGVPVRNRSRWSYEHRLRYRQNVITQALIQTAAALRLGEAVGQAHADITKDGVLTVTNPKTKKPRTIPILDPRVTEYIATHKIEGTPWVLPNPGDPERKWGNAAAKEGAAALYKELADKLDIPPLRTFRGHAWRTVVSDYLKAEGVHVDVVSAYLGHSKAVNISNYTHGVDLSAVKALIPEGTKTTV